MISDKEFIDSVILANPNSLILSNSPAHYDYISRLKDTYNYKYYSPKLIDSKLFNWDVDKKYIFNALRMIYYASYLELFLEEESPQTFSNLFHNYLKCVFEGVNDPLFRDFKGNTIFHYDAVQGKSRIKYYLEIAETYNYNIKSELGIDVDCFNVDIVNLTNFSNLKVIDILNCNNDIIIK
jgi:hypothetical protein